MIVLGLIDSKPSTAAILNDNQIVAAIAEERLCRMKLASGMPRAAITQVMAEAGISAKEIDGVAVAQRVSVFEPEPIPWSGWFKDDEQLKTYRFDHLSSMLAPILGRIPLTWKVHHQLKGLVSRERIRQIPVVLRDVFGITAPIQFYDNHFTSRRSFISLSVDTC
jgi:predicted NodU family carbamoyl transferase